MITAIKRLIRERIRLMRHILLPGLLAMAILTALVSVAGWTPLWTAIHKTSTPLLAVALLVYAATWLFRTFRLHSLSDRAGLPLGRRILFRFFLASQALNSVLPARIGDVANVLFFHWQGLAFGRAVAIILQTRVLDAAALVLVSVPALAALAGEGRSMGWAVGAFLLCILFTILPSALVWLDKKTTLFTWLEKLLLRKGTRAFSLTAQTGRDFLEEYHAVTKDRRLWSWTLGFSLIAALGEGLATWIIAKAVGADITMVVALFAVSFATIGKSATVTPGGVGVYEAVFVAVLRLFGVGFDLALLVAILDHGLKKGFNLLIGLPALSDPAIRGSAREETPVTEDPGTRPEEPLTPAKEEICVVESPETRRTLTVCGLLLIAVLALISALHWSWYPIQSDPWYHTAVIQGMIQAGGLPTWDFWEMAPVGRPHIYPMSFHVVGYLASFAGVSPAAYTTFMSWALWPVSMFTMWLWMFKVFGPRAALVSVILLCGPTAYFSHQATFPGVAFGMTIAPLALLALESEHFLACAALNLLASTAHPMALFLPPALVINTLLRRKKLLAGLLAACVPMLLYVPWLAHGWANRASLSEQRSGGDVSIMGFGIASGLNLGVALAVTACLGIGWAAARRDKALALLGPLLGCAAVFPLGFGGRLLHFSIHWPLACLGGYGAAMLFDWCMRKLPRHTSAVRIVSVSLAFVILATWVVMEVPLPKRNYKGEFVPIPKDPNLPAKSDATNASPRVYFAMNTSMAVKLLNPEMNPPSWRFERAGVRITRGVRPLGRTRQDFYHHEGAPDFFAAINREVAIGEVIYTGESGVSAYLTGCTGHWTTGGMLHEQKWERVEPERCQYWATLGGKSGRGSKAPPDSCVLIFENSFGSLYKNDVPLVRMEPKPAAVSTLNLMVLAGLGICLVLLDLLLARDRIRARVLLGGGASVVALSCVALLAWTAVGELFPPPSATTPKSGPPLALTIEVGDRQKTKP
ncbi:MAG: lysylphosphatidylglycerol synthase transmembrane domain-containing protein [Verrucomicrobiota bacterium]